MLGADSHSDRRPDQRSPNARRVERHRSHLAERGLRQVNVVAPAEAHATLKILAQRLKAGEAINSVLFDLVAQQSPSAFAARRAKDGADVAAAPTDRAGKAMPTADSADDHVLATRVRDRLAAGGLGARLLRRLLSLGP